VTWEQNALNHSDGYEVSCVIRNVRAKLWNVSRFAQKEKVNPTITADPVDAIKHSAWMMSVNIRAWITLSNCDGTS